MVRKIAARLGFRDLVFAVKYDRMKAIDEIPKYFSESFKNMVVLCLEQEFSKRETPQKLLEHDFFKNVEANDVPLTITNLLKELSSDDQRPKPLRRGRGDEVEVSECRRVKEWRYDKNGVELVPVFQGGQKCDRAEEGSEASGGLPVGPALKKMMLKEDKVVGEREAREERDRNAVAQVEGGVRNLQLQQNSSDDDEVC